MYKFWRLINFEYPSNWDGWVNGSILNFISDTIVSDNPSESFAKDFYNDENHFSHAFDGNDETYFGSKTKWDGDWYIGYLFDEAVEVKSITLKMRYNRPYRYIQYAEVEVSNDGQNWELYGVITPKLTDTEAKTVKIFPIIEPVNTTTSTYSTSTSFIPKQNPKKSTKNTTCTTTTTNYHPINGNQLYTHDIKIEGWGGNGYIAGETQKLGIPTSGVRVTCHLRTTGKLIGTTWSNEHCQYRFDNLIPGYEYYVHAIDQERKFNAVTQDILTAKEVE